MSAYSLDELIAKWKLAGLTSEQAIGQILLLLQTLTERLEALEQQLTRQNNAPRGDTPPWR
jgi:hypothetical protein